MKSNIHDTTPLRISPRTHNLEVVRAYIADAVSQTLLTAGEQHGVVLAVDEACANLMSHGVAMHSSHDIEVRVVVTGQEIVIEIRDVSEAFDPRMVESPDMAVYFQEMRSGGLGIALIRRVMDTIDYLPASSDIPFNRLILRKHHRSAS